MLNANAARLASANAGIESQEIPDVAPVTLIEGRLRGGTIATK